MHINNEFQIGQTVYLKTDPEQLKRLVVYLTVFQANDIMYDLAQGATRTSHYPFEISAEPDQNMKLGLEENHAH